MKQELNELRDLFANLQSQFEASISLFENEKRDFGRNCFRL